MNTFQRTSRVFAAAALCALGSTGAYAQASWDLDVCASGGSCFGTGTGSTTSVSISAYHSTGSSSAFASAILNASPSTGWMGIKTGSESTTGAPHHAIDNHSTAGVASTGSPFELVFLEFTKAVDLNSIASTGWTHTSGDADFQLWRWNGSGAPTITSYSPTSMTGWTSVSTTSGDFKLNQNQTVSDGVYYSSYWLISTPLTGSDGNDAFKLGSVGAAGSVCAGGANGSGGCAPSVSVPEPTSIAMVLLAGIAATSVRRRRRG